ncbi:alpha/beta fold hydrolase [Actinoplanes palleronii]|uniref:Alpha/beta hydrolase n=1 Tax=Actinoplanes palleronii TaxID=113570 RepID=A0ABQ4BU75_9ACTN|nr:alpha/beta hydrolase [Actinoplanes palleronii]GIE73735.1 alpha/beta hydrolase [Actinoplanes palleronii]
MPDLLLLHGLTYDHRIWEPLRDKLGPACRVLAVDLPGHGTSPRRPSYAMTEVADIIHEQVVAAGLTKPVVVGHSVGAIIATTYAARFPATAVLNLDQFLRPGTFFATVRAAEPMLRGPEWKQFWNRMLTEMGVESLPEPGRRLVETATDPRPDLLLGYWDEILHRSDAAIDGQRRQELETIAANGIDYHWVTATEPPAQYLQWLRSIIPEVRVTILPGGHFPHVVHPAAIAGLIAR